MGQRLRPRDLALLALESPTAPMHNATIEIFDPGSSGFDHDRLVELVADRISFVPRYRQRVQSVPGRLANPVWVDDPHFELGYHVRRSALPRPRCLSAEVPSCRLRQVRDRALPLRGALGLLDVSLRGLGLLAGRHGAPPSWWVERSVPARAGATPQEASASSRSCLRTNSIRWQTVTQTIAASA